MWKRGNGWKINPARVSTRRSEDHWSRGSGQGDWNTVWEFVVRLRNKNRSGIRSFLAFSHTNCRMISRNQNEKRDSSKELRMYNAELLYYRLFYTKIRHIYILRISVNFIREIKQISKNEKKKRKKRIETKIGIFASNFSEDKPTNVSFHSTRPFFTNFSLTIPKFRISSKIHLTELPGSEAKTRRRKRAGMIEHTREAFQWSEPTPVTVKHSIKAPARGFERNNARARTKSPARRGRRAWWYATATDPRDDGREKEEEEERARSSLRARPPVITASLVLRRRINYRDGGREPHCFA